jgi:mono/diheme cytochrome c family protein
MKPVVKAFLVLIVVVIAIGVGVVAYVATTGMSAREDPGEIETFLARNLRNLAIARRARQFSNPIERAPEIIAAGRAHFADHCATCHGNDGRGDTAFGRGMWPKPPDLRREQTQKLSDGELFYIIEHGIRFSGMPGFGTGTADGENESWHLVHFIRHLPDLSQPELAEMEKFNPKPVGEGGEHSPSVSQPHTH